MDETIDLIAMTASIVSAFVSKNSLAADELPGLIESVHAALLTAQNGHGPELRPAKAAVPIDESVTDDFLICLEDGQKFKSLKRHLKSQYGLTPEDYRVRWGLPADYPMVAPNYARERSALAKKLGLGRSAAPTKRSRKAS